MDTTLIVGQGNRSSQLLKAVTSTIDQLVSQVYEARTKVVATDGKSLMTLYLKHKHLEKCLTLYKSVYQAYSLQNKYTQSMSRALNFWQQKANELQLKKTESIRHNFKISEQSIDLSYQNKILLSKKLINYYQESRLRTTALKSATDDEKNNKDFTITRAKELALEIAMVLMELINLNKPQIQRAIEGSPAMNPTIIESGVSAQSRYHSICFMAEEVKVNKAILAERIAQNLIRYYQVPLSKATINFLVETYQANREKINFIANYETPINFRIAFDRFDSIDVPKPKTTWEEEFYYSRRVLNKFAHA